MQSSWLQLATIGSVPPSNGRFKRKLIAGEKSFNRHDTHFGVGASTARCGNGWVSTSHALMSQVAQLIILVPLGFVLYAGSLLIWPVYRLRHPKRTQRGRTLFRVFLVQLALYIVWTVILLISALRHGHWLHGVTLYIVMNALFLFVARIAWSSTVEAE